MQPRASLISLLLLVSGGAFAQPERTVDLPGSLTLDDALRLFRQRGFDLLIAEAAVQNAQGDVHAAGAVPNPNWQLWGSYTTATNCDPASSICNTPWGVTAGLGDSNAIEDAISGKRGLRLKVARAALAAAKQNRADAQRTLEFSVKQAYTQAVLARDNLDFALEVQKSAQQTYDLMHLRYNAGAISEADEAKVETFKLEAEQAVDTANQALRVAKLGVAFLLGVRGAVPDFHVDQDLPKFRIPGAIGQVSREGMLKEAFEHRPDLLAAMSQRQRAEASIRLNKRLRFPDISLNLQYQQQAGVNAAAAQPPTVSLGLAGTLPLFYFQRGEIEKAEADFRTQTLLHDKLEAQVVADVETAWTNMVSTRKLVERMEGRLLERSKRARDLVELQYKKGAASLLEFLDANRVWIANNEEYLQDLANYWTAVYQLETAVGMDLR